MNMKQRLLSLLLLVSMLLTCAPAAVAAGEDAPDFAGSVTLNMLSETVKQEVTVKTFIDGDTTHFHVPASFSPDGVLKARYLAINTPESTGKIEEYGKKAAAFTREKLSAATSIIVESDTASWNLDSTGDRHLVWVWYKTDDMTEYRNLNIEILQNGLAIANSTANNRYGSVATAALNYAKEQKLHVHSHQPDPDFYYGDAIELTLKELRSNLETYNGIKVAFNGVVTMNDNNSVYVEAFDPETGMYFGMPVYYGFGLSGMGLAILNVGNEVRIVGTLQYYEAGGTWQVSGLEYRMMYPNDPGNIQKISSGNAPAWVPTTPETFLYGTVAIAAEEETITLPYQEAALATSVEMHDLKVVFIYTTDQADSSSNGAMTLTCKHGEDTVIVRTAVLRDKSGKLITEEAYMGKTISVKGIVDFFDGGYQIKVFMPDHITIHD